MSSVRKSLINSHILKLIHQRMYNDFKKKRHDYWLPREEVLFIIIKKELKKFFLLAGKEYTELNYDAVF